MQSSGIMTTGLVSLSVHDSLTFEGVEIAINPELFTNKGGTSNVVSTLHSRDSSFASVSVSVSTPFPTVPPPSPLISSPMSSQDDSAASHSLRGESIISGAGSGSLSGSGMHSPKINATIQAGDMIEIKVWDRKPNPNQQSPKASQNSHERRKTHTRGNTNSSINSSATTVKINGSRGLNDNVNLLTKASSRLQQQISISAQQQQQQQTQEPSCHPLSKRPPMVPPRSGGVSLAASPKQANSSDTDANQQNFTQRTSSDMSDSSLLQSVDELPVSPSTLPRREEKDLANPVAIAENDSGRAGLSVIQSAPLPPPVPKGTIEMGANTNTNTGTPPSFFETSHHSRISSLGSTISNIYGAPADNSSMSMPMSMAFDSTITSKTQEDHDPLEQISQTHVVRKKFVAALTEKSFSALKAGGRTQISILKNVADLYGLNSYDLVTVTKIDKSLEAGVVVDTQADFVTMTIKDQFISRGEMYRFQKLLLGKWIYEGERLSFSDGIRGTIMDIRHGNEEYKSAFITEDTKITYRSLSARIIWLVQISSEMWDYASPYETSGGDGGACEIYFDKFVSFMYRLFEEWKALEATHSLTVVFFSRSFILPKKNGGSSLNPNVVNSPAIQRDVDGRVYEDHFKVVIENETRPDWETLVTKIKRKFISFPLEVGWKLTSDYARLPSFAAQGNTLEAINTALNMLQLHYIDRDLHRVGNSIVVVSAGSGVFEVDKGLAAITKQRMMDNGIGSDMLSLGLPPLHVAPFMLFKETRDPNNPDDVDDFDGWKAYFEIPHWMHLSYINYDEVGSQKVPHSRPIPDDREVEENRPKYNVSNGFIIRGNKAQDRTGGGGNMDRELKKGLTASQKHQRHLVLGRDFEDILEACRPRNRGDGGAPPSLLSQLKLFGLLGEKSRNNISNIIEGDEIIDKVQETPTEWNSVNLDDPSLSPGQSLLSAHNGSPNNLSLASSDFSAYSTQSLLSSFTNKHSVMLGRSPSMSPLRNMKIQLSSSIDIPFAIADVVRGTMKKSRSNGSLPEEDSIVSSCDSGSISNWQGKVWSLEAMRKAMDFHDSNIIYNEPSEFPEVESRHVAQSKSLIGTEKNFTPIAQEIQDNCGIGAAIRDYDGPGNTDIIVPMPSRSLRQSESTTVKTFKKSMNAASTNNLFHQGHFSRPASLAYSYDENSATMGLNVSNHNHSNLLLNPSMFLPGMPISSSDKVQRPQKVQLHPEQPKSKDLFISGKEISVPTSKHIRIASTRDRKLNSKRKTRHFSTRKPSKGAPPPSHHTRRKQWVLNPFRQEDEDDVLARRTHNSRRWSHVFPQGEIEFKRHAGPNWKSLCQPAILPVTIDVHPTPKELEDPSKYSFSPYQVNLDAMDVTYYASRSDLLMEMVRQRIVQDFQLVPQSVLARSRREVGDSLENNRLKHSKYKTSISSPTPGKIQHTLSMGHRIHIISSNPTSDSVDVVQYLAKNANNARFKPFVYKYNVWMPLTGRYQQVSQIFQRFPEEYPWNRLDNLISGDPDTLDSKTKYRRIAFCIIPDNFHDKKGEQAYILKAQKFLEFLERLAKQNLGVQILSTNSHAHEEGKTQKKQSLYNMTHFIVHDRKRKRHEWFELSVGTSFDTRKTYRIVFKWLVASASKIEAHLTMLQRRCSQYKLTLIVVSETSSNSDLSLNPLKRPESITISNPQLAHSIEGSLLEKFGFHDDGKHTVYPRDVERTFAVQVSMNAKDRRRRSIQAQQYLHQSGTLFVRILHDINQSVTFFFVENRPFIGNNVQLKELVSSVFRDVHTFISELSTQKALDILT